METRDHDLERLLRERRPEPSHDFVRTLEAALPTRAPRRERLRTLAAAGALCTAIAVLTAALAVTGMLPLGLRSGRDAQAEQTCRTITVVRHERRLVPVIGADGRIHAESRIIPVSRPVKSCR